MAQPGVIMIRVEKIKKPNKKKYTMENWGLGLLWISSQNWSEKGLQNFAEKYP